MALFKGTQQQYYDNSQTFTGDGTTVAFILTFSPAPSAEGDIEVFVNGTEQNSNTYAYATGTVTFTTAPADGALILVRQISAEEQLGNYQYISIDDLSNNFRVAYVGEGKIISKVKIPDINFHIQRAIQEFSYDTLKSEKSQEIEVPPSLKMKLPHDYVNYVQFSYKDNVGVERIIYPARKTSNPTAIIQDSDHKYVFDNDNSLLKAFDSETWKDFKSATSVQENAENITDLDVDATMAEGRRYGLTPENAQFNGLFFIDNSRGYVFFSSDLNGKIVTIKYISDNLGTEDEMKVHKFAEEAIYKYVAHAILAARVNTPEYVVARFKKERRAAIRQAKLRLSNLKIEEINLVMKNKSKIIKH
jgi:hypothetical protein